MNNIFVVGPEVHGESQIGYQRYLEKFTDILMNTINNISITGLKRFGKTSIAKEVLFRVKERSKEKGKVVVLFIDLAKQRSFSDFLVSIKNNLEDELMSDEDFGDKIILNPIFNRYLEKIEKANPASRTYRDTLEGIFKWLSKQNLRIILAIDEFDAASELFKETADFEFLRDLSSNRDVGLSLVLISRRQLYMIEKRNFNNSTFHGIVQTYPVGGFEKEDLDQYYTLLRDKYGIKLNNFARERLSYYCGKSPYLFSMFAYDIVDDASNGYKVNIDQIYKRREIDIENYYKSIFACLNNDKINVEGAYEEVSTVEKLVGVIVGPKINVIETDISVLENMGYLDSKNDLYFSISKHFTNALRRMPLNIDTWSAILELEKKLKAMVRKQILINRNLEVVDYDTWTVIFDDIGATAKLDIYDRFIADSMQEYKCNVDILDVCSLDTVVSILQFYWEGWFSKFFNNDSWEKWEHQLRLCASARNPMAHGHEEFLTTEARASVNEFCDTIIKLLSAGNACTDIKTEVRLQENRKRANVRRKYYEINYETVTTDLQGKNLRMMAAEQNAKGIKGYIALDGKFYCCFVGKSKWLQKFPGQSVGSHLGKEYDVEIAQVDETQNTLQINLI